MHCGIGLEVEMSDSEEEEGWLGILWMDGSDEELGLMEDTWEKFIDEGDFFLMKKERGDPPEDFIKIRGFTKD